MCRFTCKFNSRAVRLSPCFIKPRMSSFLVDRAKRQRWRLSASANMQPHNFCVFFFSFSTAFQSELIPQLARPCTVAAALGWFPRSVRTQWREAHHMTACSAHRSNHMEEMITGQEIVAQGQRKQSFCTGLSQSCPLFLSLSLSLSLSLFLSLSLSLWTPSLPSYFLSQSGIWLCKVLVLYVDFLQENGFRITKQSNLMSLITSCSSKHKYI